MFTDGQINFDSLEERLRGVYLSESVIGVGCRAGALLMPKDSIVKCNNYTLVCFHTNIIKENFYKTDSRLISG